MLLPGVARRDPGGGGNGTVRPSDPDGGVEFRRELERSRRYGYPFVLMRVAVPVIRAARPLRRKASAPAATASALSRLLRSVDSVWSADGYVYALLPGTDRHRGEAVLERIARRAPGLVAGGVQLVTFPADGLTSGALVAALEGQPLLSAPADGAGADASVAPLREESGLALENS